MKKFIFEELLDNKMNKIVSHYKKELQSKKNNDLSKILIKDLYSEFVSTYLLNKPYLMNIKDELLKLQDIDFVKNEKLFLEGQKKIENILFESVKGPVNSRLFTFISPTAGLVGQESNTNKAQFEDLFKTRFNLFSQSFISYCVRSPDEFNFFSYFLGTGVTTSSYSPTNVDERICYIFIHNLYSCIYKQATNRESKSDLFMNHKEFQEFIKNYETPFITENSLLQDFTNDLGCNSYLFFSNNIMNNTTKNFEKYLELIRLFNKIKNFKIFKSSYKEWLGFLKHWNLELRYLDPTNSIFSDPDYLVLDERIKKEFNLGNLQSKKSLNQKMVVDLFLILKNFCIESNIITSKPWKFNTNGTQSSSINLKTRTLISFSKDLSDLDEVYLVDKRLELPFIYPPKDFKFKKSYISLDHFDYEEGGYLTNNLQNMTKWAKFDRNDPFLKVGNINSKVEVLNYLQSISYCINKKYLHYLMNLTFFEIPSDYTKEIHLETYLSGANKTKGKNWILSNNENMKHFLLALFIADIFQYCPRMYFTNFFDNRHRLYLAGFPLNYQADKLFRNLFILSSEVSNKNPDRLKYYKKYFKKEEDPFHRWSIKNNIDQSLFNFDAVSSVFQISGGLSGCVEALQRTGIINTIKTGKEDIYSFIAKELATELDYDTIKALYKEFLDANKDRDNNTFLLVEEKQFINQIKDSITRSMVKSHLMPFNYNKTIISMIDTYNEKEFISIFFNKIFLKKNLLNKISTLVITTLLSLFNKYFGTLKELKNLFSELANLSFLLDRDIFISMQDINDNASGQHFPWFYEDTKQYEFNPKTEPVYEDAEFASKFKKKIKKQKDLCFYQSYYSIDSIRFRKGFGKQRYSISIRDFNATSKRNHLKNTQALAPNIIQYIDSQLLYGVVTYCKMKQIPVIVIHDCFASHIDHFEDIRKAYSLSFFEIICVNGLRNIIFNALCYFRHQSYFFNKLITAITKVGNKKGRLLLDMELLHEIVNNPIKKRAFKKTVFNTNYTWNERFDKNLYKNFHKITKSLYNILSIYKNLIENYNKVYKDLVTKSLLKKVNHKILSN